MSAEEPKMKFAEPLTAWWSWFAWYPVQTWDYRWRWLCMVERRLMQLKPHLEDSWRGPWFQHRVKAVKEQTPATRGEART